MHEVLCCCAASVVSDSVRPHRQQPTRLPCPWDSPGKNTGVGCHFLLQGMKVKSESEVAQSCPTISNPMDCSPPGSSVHGIFQARVLEWGAITFSGEAPGKLQITVGPWGEGGLCHQTWVGPRVYPFEKPPQDSGALVLEICSLYMAPGVTTGLTPLLSCGLRKRTGCIKPLPLKFSCTYFF